MAKINRIHVPYSREDNTLAQPSSVIGPDGEELREIRDEEGNLIWGKYPLLIEDDYGAAFNLWDVAESTDTYTKWDSNFTHKLKSLKVELKPKYPNYIHNVPITTTTLDFEAPEEGNSEKWVDQNIYKDYTVGLSLETSDGCYINSNKTATSWGNTTLNNPYWWTSEYLDNFSTTDGSPVLYNDLSHSQYGTVLPKYGQFSPNVSSASGTATIANGYPKRVSSLNTKHAVIPSYAYSGYNILANSKISSKDPVYFGDTIAIKASCSATGLYPVNGTECTFTLNGTTSDGTNQAEYLDTPAGKTSGQYAREVPLNMKFNYPLYFEGLPSWSPQYTYTQSGSTMNQVLRGYKLTNANLLINPFCLNSNGTAPDSTINVTLHCDAGRFIVGSYNEDNVWNYNPFGFNQGVLIGDPGAYLNAPSGTHRTSSFQITNSRASNSVTQSAKDYPWVELSKTRQLQVGRPLFYYTNIANSTTSGNFYKPTICHLTYTYKDNLYVVDYMTNPAKITLANPTTTVNYSTATGIQLIHLTTNHSDGSHSTAIVGNIKLPKYTFTAPINQTCDYSYTVTLIPLDQNSDTLAGNIDEGGLEIFSTSQTSTKTLANGISFGGGVIGDWSPIVSDSVLAYIYTWDGKVAYVDVIIEFTATIDGKAYTYSDRYTYEADAITRESASEDSWD